MNRIARTMLLGGALFFGIAVQARAQEGRVQLGHLDMLAGKAVDAVDVAFDESLLRAVAITRAAESKDPAKFKARLSGLRGVTAKGFKFSGPGQYEAKDLDLIRAQMKGDGWTRLVAVRNKNQRDNGEVYFRFQNENVAGMTIITALPDELYVINVAGTFGLEDISMEEGIRGLSKLDAAWSKWTANRPRGSWRD